MAPPEKIRLVLTDVDGTLVTSDKQLTPAAVDAIGRLGDAGITFAVTSGRPPRGMEMLVEPLGLTTPIAAFNGGMFVHPDMTVISTKELPAAELPGILSLLAGHQLDAWLYAGAEWYVRDPGGSHVDKEAATVQFAPTVVESFDGLDAVVKVVGVSSDHHAVARAETATREQYGDHVSAARSQPYYLDITHPDANKGGVVTYLSDHLDIPRSAIATLGDMPNDVLMFAHCALSIAMGNASGEVQRAARRVTTSNDDDGFAHAVDRFILGAP